MTNKILVNQETRHRSKHIDDQFIFIWKNTRVTQIQAGTHISSMRSRHVLT